MHTELVKMTGYDVDPNFEKMWQYINNTELYLNAIHIDPTNSYAYDSLASAMMINNCDTIELYDGRKLNKYQLLLKSIELYPGNAKAYVNLAIVCKRFSTPIILNDGRHFNQIQLLLEGLRYDSCISNAYHVLGELLPTEQQFITINKKIFTREQLFLEALAIDIYNPCAYLILARLTKESETKYVNGRHLNKLELLTEAYKYRPPHSSPPDDLIMAMNIRKLSKYWNRNIHVLEIYDPSVNVLLATLFLSIQKFEQKGYLHLAHQAMFEDMLEFWEI